MWKATLNIDPIMSAAPKKARAIGLSVIWTPKPSKITLQVTQNFLGGISKNVNSRHIIEYLSPQYHSHGIAYEHYALFHWVNTRLWL